MAEVRECAQCGTPFTPRREHARFCSAQCRMTWNRAHAGVAAAPAVAIDWSVTAMTEAAGRLAKAGSWDLSRLAVAVGETVWWVTLVDATLVRYHLRDYEAALASETVRRRETEETLEGLRYVRNQLGKSVDPVEFIRPAPCDDGTAWRWHPRPEPGLGALAPRARQWELSRYRAYQARLAGRGIGRTFNRCTEFLAQAAARADGNAGHRPGIPENLPSRRLLFILSTAFVHRSFTFDLGLDGADAEFRRCRGGLPDWRPGLAAGRRAGPGAGTPFMLVSKYFFSDVAVRGLIIAGRSRVAAQVVSGAGFLGAAGEQASSVRNMA